ncbi:hypothetical protein U1Q18_002796 [Sarracenia purpurea var. burkii]
MDRARDCLGFCFDSDVERADPGGENAGEEFAGEGVEEMEPWLRQLLEPPPPLHHTDSRLPYASFDSVAWTLEFCIPGGFWALLGGFLPVISGRVCVLVRLAGFVVFWVAFSDPSLQPVLVCRFFGCLQQE